MYSWSLFINTLNHDYRFNDGKEKGRNAQPPVDRCVKIRNYFYIYRESILY